MTGMKEKSAPPAAVEGMRRAWLEVMRELHPGFTVTLLDKNEPLPAGAVVVSLADGVVATPEGTS